MSHPTGPDRSFHLGLIRRLLSRLSGIFGTDDDIVLVRVERWGANLSGHSFFHEAGSR